MRGIPTSGTHTGYQLFGIYPLPKKIKDNNQFFLFFFYKIFLFDFPVKKYFLGIYYKIHGASEKIGP